MRHANCAMVALTMTALHLISELCNWQLGLEFHFLARELSEESSFLYLGYKDKSTKALMSALAITKDFCSMNWSNLTIIRIKSDSGETT